MSDEKSTHGTFCWNELVTRDDEGAAKFYTELLGWKIVDSGMPGMKYSMLNAGDKNAGGMMAMPPDVPAEVPSHWLAYITVDDVDAAAAKAKELGGTILQVPTDIPTIGRFCIIQDPTSAVVALITLTG
ncbi:MAG: VOC family protein [candidate division Zixibacteria bacterium]|nr:VOC family protein [candidate division Zixibacteria bacterium]